MATSERPRIRVFCSDLDGTLLGNPEASQRFKIAWQSLPDEQRPLLIYSSGRLVNDLSRFVQNGALPHAEFFIGGVGTQIFDTKTGGYLSEFEAHLRGGWDVALVREIMRNVRGVHPQPEEFQHAFKSSWFLNAASHSQIREIEDQLKSAGLSVHVVYSSGRDLDVLPQNATKGGALNWLCARLGVPLPSVLVAGDTGNDSSMFRLAGINGIVVENAQPELYEATVDLPVYSSRKIIADGVLDGLLHYGVISALPRLDATEAQPPQTQPGFHMLFQGADLSELSDAEKNYLRTAYEKAVVALKKNITPLGFSACSLADNEVTGTDANYRSVWARDGAITIWSTLHLSDPEVRQAQIATFETLLGATSPNGQIPANVRIDTGEPDYSGVGNIASIDSGLWVIIALYNFARATGDYTLLYRHADRLQSVMNWLSAHDSNNDALLEIPEAGDWTDLFGRSYNILYDEVLWFRANVCYGRILEYMGHFEQATHYLRWSQKIRGRVLDLFWPRTSGAAAHDARPLRFADRQYTLGDTQYLLAEITPFGFNWRCDVFGNILAFLMNLLDLEQARTAFRFMWGSGVNQPWPVANLYPVVQSGDPDWRPYYTVNLLNLPHHYHNGGIWPLVGGMWVRYIHRLGFRAVACRELYRLAQLNEHGRDHPWEFNEWSHGQTGRPMGKAFQAWSAASFLRACHEVDADPASLALES